MTSTGEEEADSSSDSDSEGRVRNISRAVMRPPGHSGKAKKGHLIFDASFESGNLGRVDRINDFEYELFVRPDISNPCYRFWFNFTVENASSMQRVVFNIVNLSKVCHLFHEGFAPVVRSSTRPHWCRLPAEYAFYHRSPHHRMRYIFSLAFVFDREDDVYQFALCYPYTLSKLRQQLVRWQQFASSLPALRQASSSKPSSGLSTTLRFEIKTIGKSLQNRPIEMLTISDDESSAPSKKVVVIIGRVHPAETPTSFVCQGIVDFLLSDDPAARCLRRHATFHIFPMVNPDGVYVGNTRTSVIGADLNRFWHKASSLMHPELTTIKEAVDQISRSAGEDADLCLDLHAHTNLMGACIYGTSFDDVFRMERHALFPKILSQVADDFYIDNTIYCKEPLRSGSNRRCMASMLTEKANCYTLEVSYYGFYDKTTLGNTIIPYDEQRYVRLGHNICLALVDVYKTIGHIRSDSSAPESTSRSGLEVSSHQLHHLHNVDSQHHQRNSIFKLMDPLSKLTLQTMQENND